MSALREGLCPALTTDACAKLKRARIKTVLDFVHAEPEELARKSNVNFRDILGIRKVLLVKYSALPRTGADLLDDMLASRAMFSTGCKKLDNLLDGGLFTGEIMEVTGSPASGKTQVCLAIAVQVAAVNQKAVLYVDTSGGFNCHRIQEMMEARGFHEVTTNFQADSLRYSFVRDIFHLFSLIDQIKADLDKQKDAFHTSLRVLIIDSVTSLLGSLFGGNQLEGHGLMVQLAQSLNYLCAEYSLVTIVINNVVQDNMNSQLLKPALGQYWQHVPSTRILLQRTEETTKDEPRRLLTLLKSGRVFQMALKNCAFRKMLQQIRDSKRWSPQQNGQVVLKYGFVRRACGQSVVISITSKGIA